MPPKPSFIAAESPAAHPASLRPPRFAFYLVVLLLPTFLAYLLPILLLRLPSFETWGGSIYGPALDFTFHAANQNADVVLFGDSSALYGINPTLITRETGLSTINLPNTIGNFTVLDDLGLTRYLRANRPPRLIVLYFSTWDLDYRSLHYAQVMEGEEMLFRNGTLPEIWAYARRHPTDTLLFPIEMYSAAPKPALMAHLRHEDRVAAISATMGHLDAQSFRAHVEDPCTILPELVGRTGFNSAQILARRYATSQTKILIFVAPIPACTNASQVLNRSWSALPGAPPNLMKPSFFMQDGYYTHLDPSGVPEASHALAQAIESTLR